MAQIMWHSHLICRIIAVIWKDYMSASFKWKTTSLHSLAIRQSLFQVFHLIYCPSFTHYPVRIIKSLISFVCRKRQLAGGGVFMFVKCDQTQNVKPCIIVEKWIHNYLNISLFSSQRPLPMCPLWYNLSIQMTSWMTLWTVQGQFIWTRPRYVWLPWVTGLT